MCVCAVNNMTVEAVSSNAGLGGSLLEHSDSCGTEISAGDSASGVSFEHW